MNVSNRQLKAFVAVANSGSVAEAAEALHLSQPAISIALKNLEETIGGALFNRNGRRLSLTPEGEEFLPDAMRLLRDWDNAFADLHDLFALRRGKLSIAAMPSVAATTLPKVLSAFQTRHPSINIEVMDVVMEEVLKAVASGRADLGITFEPDESEGLEFTALYDDRFLAVLPAGHPLLVQKQIRWQQLAELPFVAMNRGSATRQWIDKVLHEHIPEFAVRCEAGQLVTIGRMVAEGLGVSAVPEVCRQQMEEVGAVCRPLIRPAVSRRVGVFTRRRHTLSVAAGEMLELLKEMWG